MKSLDDTNFYYKPINFHFLMPFTFFGSTLCELLNSHHPSLKWMTKYTTNNVCDLVCFKIVFFLNKFWSKSKLC